ncbi:hypothetical protein [Pseudomonas sp. NPDC089758]|uniref:hypothetical protein n=1 Tax=Pseudomonas sp. NPDC089758 TaxID=3364473 RepID=UPI0038248F7B
MTRIVEVEHWLKSLGETHATLLGLGLDPDLPFIKLYSGATELYLEPEPGVSYRLDTETKVLQAVIVTIIRRVELEPEFKDLLSQPYGCRDKDAVRATWGNPISSRGPMAMPPPIGKTGGWDIYELSSQGFASVELTYNYTTDFKVSGVVLRAKEDEA